MAPAGARAMATVSSMVPVTDPSAGAVNVMPMQAVPEVARRPAGGVSTAVPRDAPGPSKPPTPDAPRSGTAFGLPAGAQSAVTVPPAAIGAATASAAMRDPPVAVAQPEPSHLVRAEPGIGAHVPATRPSRGSALRARLRSAVIRCCAGQVQRQTAGRDEGVPFGDLELRGATAPLNLEKSARRHAAAPRRAVPGQPGRVDSAELRSW